MQATSIRVSGDPVKHLPETSCADPEIAFARVELALGQADPMEIDDANFRFLAHLQTGGSLRKLYAGLSGASKQRKAARCADPRQNRAACPMATPNRNRKVAQRP